MRAAALVRFGQDQDNKSNPTLTIKYLRSHLQDKVSAYKLPTVMRVLRDGEDVQKTDSGKIRRREAAAQYFLVSETLDLCVDVEVFYDNDGSALRSAKVWDWAGTPGG